MKNFVIEWYGSQKRLGVIHPGYTEMKRLVESKKLNDYFRLNDAIRDVANKMVQMMALIMHMTYCNNWNL